ncbi:hypothetical protein DIJ64_13195 [Mycobacterium leprae]|uniref:Uncharacterized protein n=1 Tax=Mycobacterium leprae TaxID=1769 RepID=A0AAD0KX73_MYCLR|nr:hypothetical protein DIJ64_13195 [Mycobacterium leprae]
MRPDYVQLAMDFSVGAPQVFGDSDTHGKKSFCLLQRVGMSASDIDLDEINQSLRTEYPEPSYASRESTKSS